MAAFVGFSLVHPPLVKVLRTTLARRCGAENGNSPIAFPKSRCVRQIDSVIPLEKVKSFQAGIKIYEILTLAGLLETVIRVAPYTVSKFAGNRAALSSRRWPVIVNTSRIVVAAGRFLRRLPLCG